METFTATTTFSFMAESVEEAGSHLRRLHEAAASAGFELIRGTVEPAAARGIDADDSTPYGPDVT
jgi:hypothetical protein